MNRMGNALGRDDPESEESDDLSDEEQDQQHPQSYYTEVSIYIHNKSTQRDEIFRVLLDTGTTRCLATRSAAIRAGLRIKTARRVKQFKTAAGTFGTREVSKIPSHTIAGFSGRRKLQKTRVRIAPGDLGKYDFIFGRNYLAQYGINILFSDRVIEWDGLRISMDERPNDPKVSDDLDEMLQDPSEMSHAQQILDSKYEKIDLAAVAKDQKHLPLHERDLLLEVFKRHGELPLFTGELGEWPDEEISVTLRPNTVPYHCQRPIRIPHIHMSTLRKEIDRLVAIGVLEEVNGMEAGPWCAPSFIISKKDNRVRFITDFRELNKCIYRRPWPMPHIMDLLQDIGKYRYVTALDLSMGYYHFRLSDALADLSTFMLPFGLYRYRRLPMGLNVSPDLFQERLSKLFADLQYMKVYLDDLLIFSNGSYEDHLAKVDEALRRLKSKNLAVNALKSFWAVEEVDYLGFRLTPNGVLPQPKKVQSILAMTRPTSRKQLRRFIGMVNFYRYMWRKRSHVLAPLADLTSKTTPFLWKPVHQHAFDTMKAIIAKEVLLSFPDYSQRFQLYTDASDTQLGAVLRQGDKTLAFFSKKLTKAQLNYGVGEKEMLSVVEALREFRTMISGYPIDVFIDHKNWSHDSKIKNARVLRWPLLLEEYDLTFKYIKGEKNIVADSLSRLPFDDKIDDDEMSAAVLECFDNSPWRDFYQPITIAEIEREQKSDKYTRSLQEKSPDSIGILFEDIGRKSGPDRVYTERNPHDQVHRIIVPETLRKRLMKWYHTMLLHPGADRLYITLHQHYTWPNMSRDVSTYVKNCPICQRAKRGLRGYGKLPVKDPETEPWKDIAVDLTGPWKAVINGKTVEFNTLTIIDVFTSWVEILPIATKKAEHIRDLFVQEWLRRYPRPSRIIYDAGTEFDNAVFRAMCTQWYIKPEPITVKNPQANSIVERMHRILGDMLRVQLARTHAHDDPIRDMTSAAAFALRATVHGVTKFSPSQLAFSKDMILRTHMDANVELVRQRREASIRASNVRENKRRIAYDYEPGHYVLVLSSRLDPKLQLHQGPYKVLSYNKSNGTLHIQRNSYVESINIRRVRPFFGKPPPST